MSMQKLTTIARHFMDRLKKESINAYAAEAALFLIISAFPFTMVLLNLFQYFPFDQNDLILLAQPFLPDTFDGLVANVLQELYQKSSGTLLSISAIFTLWTASKGALSIVHGLNAAYDIEEHRNYFVMRAISCFYTLSCIIVILFSLLVLVFGNIIYSLLCIQFPILKAFSSIFVGLRSFILLGLLTTFFMFLYKTIPDRNSKLLHHAPGALFASFGWIVFSLVFSFYVDRFGNYSYIYGSLSTVVLSILWLYFCMYIVFLGAEINHFFEPRIAQFMLSHRIKTAKRQE